MDCEKTVSKNKMRVSLLCVLLGLGLQFLEELIESDKTTSIYNVSTRVLSKK